MLERINFYSLKLIYETYPNIDFIKINGICLHNKNSLNIYTPNNIVKWLKSILDEQMYTLVYNIDFTLIIIDNMSIDNNLKVNNQNSNDLSECVLCLDNPDQIISSCSHKYCSYCIRRWIKKNNSCPICRNSNNIKFCYL